MSDIAIEDSVGRVRLQRSSPIASTRTRLHPPDKGRCRIQSDVCPHTFREVGCRLAMAAPWCGIEHIGNGRASASANSRIDARLNPVSFALTVWTGEWWDPGACQEVEGRPPTPSTSPLRPDWVSRGRVSKESGSNTLMRLRLNRLGALVATAARVRAAFTARATTGQCVTGVPGLCQRRDTEPLGASAMGLTPGPGTPDRGRLGPSAVIG